MKNDAPNKGKLFVVSTPIGNKDDITLRALNVLKICDLVLCEELKEGAKLLKSINLQKPMEPLNEQNETEQALVMLDRLEAGEKIALISDCGTPLFADPGSQLVKAAIKADISVEVVPGASSIMTAIVRSGMDTSSFLFAGFLSRKTDERLSDLKRLSKEPRTVVLLETPYRFNSFLESAAEIMPNRLAYIGMNLTMAYETHHYGTFSELNDKFGDQNVKAEFVICFEGDMGENTFSKAADRMYRNDSYDSPRPPRRDFKSNDRSFGDRKPFRDKPRSDRDGNRKPWGDKPKFDRDRGEKQWDDKPRSSRFGDRDGNKKPWGDKPKFDRDRSDKPWDDKPRPSRFGDRDGNKKPWGDKPKFDRDDKKRRFDDDKPFKKRSSEDREGGSRERREGFGPKKTYGKPSGAPKPFMKKRRKD